MPPPATMPPTSASSLASSAPLSSTVVPPTSSAPSTSALPTSSAAPTSIPSSTSPPPSTAAPSTSSAASPTIPASTSSPPSSSVPPPSSSATASSSPPSSTSPASTSTPTSTISTTQGTATASTSSTPRPAWTCYQSVLTSLLLSGSSAPCPTPSAACSLVVNYATQTVTRSCQSTNCSFAPTAGAGTCVYSNTTDSATCCCYGNGCNDVPPLRSAWVPSPPLSILTSIPSSFPPPSIAPSSLPPLPSASLPTLPSLSTPSSLLSSLSPSPPSSVPPLSVSTPPSTSSSPQLSTTSTAPVYRKCFQTGARNSTPPFDQTASSCPAGANGCVLVIDASTNTTTRGCRMGSCTFNGVLNHPGFCQLFNNSMFVGTYCCCSRDGCNYNEQTVPSDTEPRPSFDPLLTTLLPPINRLQAAHPGKQRKEDNFELNGEGPNIWRET
ncbi:hypothetical protein M3Y99_01536000 [Aphelenchoides fujianensis]|nr:hypothetical protein M3Y99_01536000 [Aphelenchoides fujianensis]